MQLSRSEKVRVCFQPTAVAVMVECILPLATCEKSCPVKGIYSGTG